MTSSTDQLLWKKILHLQITMRFIMHHRQKINIIIIIIIITNIQLEINYHQNTV